MVLVGREAPQFTAPAVMPDNSIHDMFSLREYAYGKKVILFFYPLDFTFVCPSEIIAVDKRILEFEKRGAVVITVSVDSHYTHLAYKNTPVENGGIGLVRFPMIADLTKKISADYGVLAAPGVAFRATFLIDKNHIIRHQVVNDLPLGRNVDEILRMIDALEHFEKHGEVCPANWKKGEDAINPTPNGIASYLKKNAVKL